jgi:hypothetical protein
MGIISGYQGVVIPPRNKTNYNSLFLITDNDRTELNIIANQPGFYEDAYNIAKMVSYQTVNIFAVSISALFISDIFRLVNDLSKIKANVKFVYPEAINIQTNLDFDMRKLIQSSYVNQADSNITIEYEKTSIVMDGGLYNIHVRDGVKHRVICAYVDATTLPTLYNNTEVSEIHLPYTKTLYGGLTYVDIFSSTDLKQYSSKCMINAVSNMDEWSFIYGHTTYKLCTLDRLSFI